MNIALFVVLGLSALLDLVLGAWAGIAWGSFIRVWHLNFGSLAPETLRDTQLLGLVLGFCLLCFTALQALAIYWIRREKAEGQQLAILFGGYLIVSSVVTFVLFRRVEFLLVDGLRGAVLAVLAVAGLNAPATVRELRLPAVAAERGPRGRDAGPRRARGEFAEGGRRDRRPSSRPGRAHPERDGERGRGRRRRGEREAGGGLEEPRPEPGERVESRDRQEARPHPPRDRQDPRERLRPVVSGADAGPPPPVRPARKAHPDEEGNLPLTVVIRGGTDNLRPRSGEDAPPAVEEAGFQNEAGSPYGDRRRRRRRRRPRGTSAMEPSAEPDHRRSEPHPMEEPRRAPPPEPVGPIDRPPPREGSSGYVEALDMLSMLEPAARERETSDEKYGRTRRPVARRRAGGPPHAGGDAESPSTPEAEETPTTSSSSAGPRPTPSEENPPRPHWPRPTEPVREDEDGESARGEEDS